MLLALFGLALTTPLRGAPPRLSRDEVEVLYLLWLLFAAVAGLRQKGLFVHLAARLERGPYLALKLVLGTFVLAALVTNDAALLAAVPLVLALENHRAALAALLVVAANAGSALTPFGKTSTSTGTTASRPKPSCSPYCPLGSDFCSRLPWLRSRFPQPPGARPRCRAYPALSGRSSLPF